GEEYYQVTIGGRADESAELGKILGPAVPYGEIADVVEDIAAAYLELREPPDEIFIDTVARVGVDPFKERVYAARLGRPYHRRSFRARARRRTGAGRRRRRRAGDAAFGRRARSRPAADADRRHLAQRSQDCRARSVSRLDRASCSGVSELPRRPRLQPG